MAEEKKCVLLYCDIIHTIEELNDDEAGKLFKHYLRYINDKNPEAPDKLTKILFEPIKQTLKRDLVKWEAEKLKKSNGGKKGMITRWGKSVISEDNTVTEVITPITVKDKVIVKVKEEAATSREKVYEYLRGAAPIGTSKQTVEAETDKLLKAYAGQKIGNLKALCNKWMAGFANGEQLPEKQSAKQNFGYV